MVTSNTNKELMRETVVIAFLDGETGVENTVFDIPIPENSALELHGVDFGISMGSNPVATRFKMILVDDPDEIADPGHSAEKVIQSTEFHYNFLTSGRSQGFLWESKDCHRTLLVQNPNFIGVNDIDLNTTGLLYARIWFDFVKVSPKQILDLLRQQQI